MRQAISLNMGNFSWSGSVMNYFTLYLEPLRTLCDHPKRQVRRWAKAMLRHLDARIESARNKDEELHRRTLLQSLEGSYGDRLSRVDQLQGQAPCTIPVHPAKVITFPLESLITLDRNTQPPPSAKLIDMPSARKAFGTGADGPALPITSREAPGSAPDGGCVASS